jgi:hypothetical protein
MVDDLDANDLLGADHPQACWERSVETFTARKDDIEAGGHLLYAARARSN